MLSNQNVPWLKVSVYVSLAMNVLNCFEDLLHIVKYLIDWHAIMSISGPHIIAQIATL